MRWFVTCNSHCAYDCHERAASPARFVDPSGGATRSWLCGNWPSKYQVHHPKVFEKNEGDQHQEISAPVHDHWQSTFANAFASALAPHDSFTATVVADAIRDLGQDHPEADLLCVYCGESAATWDHVFNRVVRGDFSGHGHRIRNLVPCCRSCNESKGQKPWRDYLDVLAPPDKDLRVARMEKFLSTPSAQPVGTEAMRHKAGAELERFLEIRSQVFDLIAEADRLAVVIRQKRGE